MHCIKSRRVPESIDMVEISTFVSRLWVCLSCQVTRLADSPHLPPLSHPSVIKVAYIKKMFCFCSVHIGDWSMSSRLT